jgi:hypothetical protein
MLFWSVVLWPGCFVVIAFFAKDTREIKISHRRFGRRGYLSKAKSKKLFAVIMRLRLGLPINPNPQI